MAEKKRQRKLPEGGALTALMIVTWVTYFSLYLGRLNFSACMSDMIGNGGFSKAELGIVPAAFFCSYGFGQFLSGLLGDRLPPKYLVFAGVLCSALINLAFPFCQAVPLMAAAWFVNGLAQSLVWAPMARFIADLAPGPQCVRIILVLSTTSPAGTLCAYGVSAVAIQAGGWRASFFAAAALLLAVSLFWLSGSLRLERIAEARGSWEPLPQSGGGAQAQGSGGLLRMLLPSGMVVLLAGACLHGTLKDGLMTWIPTYLTESFAIAPSFSVALTTVMPIVNLLGVYLANRWNQRVFRNEAYTAAGFFACSLASLLLLVLFGGASLPLSVLLFAVVTSAMTAANTVFNSILPLHFRKSGAVSTATGFLNAATYVGSALASGLFGKTAELWGWGGTQMLWLALAAAGCLCALAGKRWAAWREDIYQT